MGKRFMLVCKGDKWSREWELNPRPADYESAALPLSYLGLSSSYGLFRELPTAI